MKNSEVIFKSINRLPNFKFGCVSSGIAMSAQRQGHIPLNGGINVKANLYLGYILK